MIVGFRDEWLRAFLVGDTSSRSVPPDLEDFHSIPVNTRSRLIFRWDGGRGEAAGVYLDDHRYQ